MAHGGIQHDRDVWKNTLCTLAHGLGRFKTIDILIRQSRTQLASVRGGMFFQNGSATTISVLYILTLARATNQNVSNGESKEILRQKASSWWCLVMHLAPGAALPEASADCRRSNDTSSLLRAHRVLLFLLAAPFLLAQNCKTTLHPWTPVPCPQWDRCRELLIALVSHVLPIPPPPGSSSPSQAA